MHGLERPHQFAGLGAQCDDRVGVLVISGPLAAPKIRARRAGRQEHQPALFIRRHRRPDIGMAGLDAVVKQRIETPARPSAPRVEGAHEPKRRIDAAVVADRRADDDHAAAHQRRGRDLKLAWRVQRLADIDLDFAAAAEIRAWRAGLGVERDEARIIGVGDNARAARCANGCLLVHPISDAAAVVAVGDAGCGADLRIEPPHLGAAAGIERDHLVEGRAEDHAVLDEQRRRLEFGARHHVRRAAVEIAGAELPGLDQISDIGRRDHSERRKPRAAAVSAPMLPRQSRRGDEACEGKQAGELSHFPYDRPMPDCYFDFLAVSAGRATPHGSYFSFGSGIFSSAAL